MAEKKIYFKSGQLKIEGLIEDLEGDHGVVVCHPHPLHGGDMHNYVVDTVCRVYRNYGYSTLRFNFRGAGNSEGNYEEGIGEQDDVKAALDYFSGMGKQKIDLAGYSFGSWVCAMGIAKYDQALRMIMISPPVSMIDFNFLKYNNKIKLVITGENDDIASHATIKKMLPVWNPESDLKIIEGSDHFYSNKINELENILKEFLEKK